MARWEDALDAQLDLVVQHAQNPGLRAYCEGWWRSFDSKMGWAQQGGWAATQFADRVVAAAFNADAIWVDPDMMTIWEHALDGFQPEPLVPEDLVAPAGFLYLPRPFMSKDVHGKLVSVRAILWSPIEHILMPDINQIEAIQGELPAPFSVRVGDMLVPAQRVGNQLVAPGLVFMTFSDTRDKDDYGWERDGRKIGFTGLAVNHFMPWPFNATFDRGGDKDPGVAVDLGALAFQALWRLMQQTLAVRGKMRPDRHTRKRMARVKFPEREVTVVRLRRVEPDRERSDEPRVVHWSHRWLVGGHWRMQPYPKLGITRQIWISPYVKGPAELELRPRKARVFELVR